MKLFYSTTSPYARKNLVLAKELGLDIELEVALPMEDPATLHQANPLGKVPALIDDEGNAWFDSAIINRVMLAAAPDHALASRGDNVLAQDQVEALASGMTEAAFWIAMEGRRSDAEPSKAWIARWNRAIDRSLPELEARLDIFEQDFNLPAMAVAAALGYLDLRHKDRDWRKAVPKLGSWYDVVSQRPSMMATRPDA